MGLVVASVAWEWVLSGWGSWSWGWRPRWRQNRCRWTQKMCMLMGSTVHELAVVRHVCLEAKISMHCIAMGSFMVAIHSVPCSATRRSAVQCHAMSCTQPIAHQTMCCGQMTKLAGPFFRQMCPAVESLTSACTASSCSKFAEVALPCVSLSWSVLPCFALPGVLL